ncbi:MAG: FAD:protein FMN transferase, partial [Methylibium sp.]
MSMSSLSSVGRRAAGAVRMPAAAWVQGGWMRREEAIMGTSISVELWSEDPSAGNAAMDLVIGEMHRIDRGMSPHKPDSELSRINREAAVRPVPLSEEMFVLLARSLEFSRRSEGAFDITFAGAGRLYDYRERIRPTDAALAQACAAVGHQYLELDAAARSVRFARDGLRIDLGGFAKGHAVDNAAAILARRGFRHAFISAGGDSRVIGDRRGRPWT